MELSERKKKILRTIIDDYISTAMPVGSKTIADHMGVKISPATIRNEMNELENMGYLEQPHTSAGRIPSDKAFRLYVDSLMELTSLSEGELDYVCHYYDRKMVQTESILRAAARAISNATEYASLVMAPQLHAVTIRYIQLVPITQGSALAVIITDAGIIKDTPIALEGNPSPDELNDLSKVLNRLFAGRYITQAELGLEREIVEEMKGLRALFRQIMEILRAHLCADAAPEIQVEGAARLLSHPEYNDVERAKDVLSLLEAKDRMGSLLLESSDVELKVRIGAENGESGMKDCSLVTATYKIGDENMGTIGVIGPVRMKYDKVIKVLNYMSGSLSEVLTQLSRGASLREGQEEEHEQEEK